MLHKQFRIEKMLGVRPEPVQVSAADPVAEFKRNLAALVRDDEGRRLTRAAAELGAAIESMEKATQVVLAAAESIDDGVRTMSSDKATVAGHERAPQMQQRIAQIYEACNFQDLAGQRIGKVIALLTHLEEQLVHVVADGHAPAQVVEKPEGGLVNGPRLDGATGHVSQQDVDILFG